MGRFSTQIGSCWSSPSPTAFSPCAMCCRPEKYLNSSLGLWQVLGCTNLNPKCISEPFRRKFLLFWVYKVRFTWCNYLSEYESMLIEYLSVCGSNLHAVFLPDNMSACHRQQNKNQWGKKLLIHELLVDR